MRHIFDIDLEEAGGLIIDEHTHLCVEFECGNAEVEL